jgi:hypothetical protein
MRNIAATLLFLLTCWSPGQTAPATAPSTAPAAGWTVLFRSDDPSHWNTRAGKPEDANGFAIPLGDASLATHFMRMKRMDTGEVVIVPITRDQLMLTTFIDQDLEWRALSATKAKRGDAQYQLLGLARHVWTADHEGEPLIVFAKNGKGYRGWGFSKQVGSNTAQTYSWAGKQIPTTAFEIAITASDLSAEESSALLSGSPIAAQKGIAKIARAQTSIHGLTVRFTDNGSMLGGTLDLILTATPGMSRDATPVSFATPVGNQMKLVLADVLRTVRLKYPRWEASKVEVSFSDRASKLDGPSIGAALGTMLLSMLEGYEIDSKLAMTGDVTADGKVRQIGGVVAKIRAATSAECNIVAMPASNYEQLVDGLVYEGPTLFSKINVIGIGTLDDAVAVARQDRDEKLQHAIELFAEVQDALKKSPEQIHAKAIRDKLSQLVDLAPNHYSAKILSLVAQDKAPQRLTSGASMYYMAVAIRGVLPALKQSAKATDRQAVTPAAVRDGIKTLDRLRRIADPSMIPLVSAYRDFISAVADAQAGTGSRRAIEDRLRNVEDAEAKVKANRDVMEKMLREGV